MADRRVLVTCPLIIDAIDTYDEAFERHGLGYDAVETEQALTETELLDHLDDHVGMIAGDDAVTRRVVEERPALTVVSKWGIGTDNIDEEAAREHDVTVTNTPGAFDAEVADVAIGYLVMLARELHRIDDRVRHGDWYCPRGRSLDAMTLGVVGVGSIGSAVARRAAAHGMDVLGYDVEPIPQELRDDAGLESVGLDELFASSDAVTLHCPATPETRDVVDAAALDAMPDDGLLINTARGELVDETALLTALEQDRIGGAALDVFVREPLPADHPLTEREDVILGSHNAQNTREAVDAVNDRAVRNLLEGLDAATDTI